MRLTSPEPRARGSVTNNQLASECPGAGGQLYPEGLAPARVAYLRYPLPKDIRPGQRPQLVVQRLLAVPQNRRGRARGVGPPLPCAPVIADGSVMHDAPRGVRSHRCRSRGRVVAPGLLTRRLRTSARPSRGAGQGYGDTSTVRPELVLLDGPEGLRRSSQREPRGTIGRGRGGIPQGAGRTSGTLPPAALHFPGAALFTNFADATFPSRGEPGRSRTGP